LNVLYRNSYQAFSAGIVPTAVNPYATEVMKEIGIDISTQYSKSIEEFKNTKFDVVATVCDNAREACPFFPGKKIIHKNFKDPSDTTGSIEEILQSFRVTRDNIKKWITKTFGD